jgi:hypothetical protein
MDKFNYKQIYNQDENGSSAFLFDLRNSTAIIRLISWDKRLPKHIRFMMKLHEKMYNTIYDYCNPDKFAMNDTGDGYLCVFWDKTHALTCLDIAIRVQEFLESNLPRHNKELKLGREGIPKFDYGFGIHSGGSTVNKATYTKDSLSLNKDFIFGIVVNTAARLESFTKNYINFKFLVTGNYKDTYLEHATSKNLKDLFEDENTHIQYLGKADIKDGKEEGHDVYALKSDFINKFRQSYRAKEVLG